MKKLYTFVVPREQEIEKSEETKNEAGETVITKKKVKEIVEHTFYLRRPNRTLYDNAEFFHGKQVGRAITAGLLTVAQLEKRFLNDGGILSEEEKKVLDGLRIKLRDKTSEFQKLSLKGKEERTEEENKRFDEVFNELFDINERLQSFEMANESFYSNTAERVARNKLVVWWLLFLAYKNDGTPFFAGETEDEKFISYDAISESDDDFAKLIMQKFLYFITLWITGRAQTEEQFEYFNKRLSDE